MLLSFTRRRTDGLEPLRSKRTVIAHFVRFVPRIVTFTGVPAVTTAGVIRTVSFLRLAASAAIGDSANAARHTKTILLINAPALPSTVAVPALVNRSRNRRGLLKGAGG